MNNINSLLQTAYEQCLSRSKELDILISKNKILTEQYEKVMAGVNEKLQDVSRRQEAVKEVESVMKYRKDTEALIAQCKADGDALRKERVAFDKYVGDINKKFEIDRGLLKQQVDTLVQREKSLEQEKKFFKDKIIQEVHKSLGK